MVQIHGMGRYIIIATKSILVLILGIPVGIGVSVVVHHRLVSISHRGGHSVGVSEGGGVGDGLDGLDHGGGVGHGGGLEGVSISHGGFLDLLVLNGFNLGLGVDNGSIRGGITLRVVAISVVENLRISFSLSLGLSLVESRYLVSLGSIGISVMIRVSISDRGGHRVGISDGGGYLVSISNRGGH